ncbi:MAG TPA: glycosyltransferase family 4 protein [Capillimicrobium sp.]|nr:glycosyltransferase family 4 protein [Capillimicrobium sp.]
MTEPGRPLRVHVLIDSLNWGGAETLLADFAAGAPAAGLDVSVGYLQDVNGSPSAQRLRGAGVEPTLVGVRRLLDAESVLRVRRHLAEVRPDVVHTHLGAADVHGMLAARSLRLPVVSTIHLVGEGGGDARTKARERVMALARRRSRRVIAVSDAARRAYLDGGWDRPGHVVTVHNGIAVRPLRATREETRAALGVPPDAPLVALVSVLRAGKGHAVAAEAVGRLLPRFPGLRLLVAGDGPARDEVAHALAPLGDAALSLGFRSDALELIAAADVLLLPTRMDAFPTSLLEAAAVGVPVVATRVGGIPEIVDDGVTGVLVEPPPRAADVEAALAGLLADPERRAAMGAAARERFATRFTAESWARRCRAVYDAVLP